MDLETYHKRIKQHINGFVESITLYNKDRLSADLYFFVLCDDHIKAYCYYDPKNNKTIPVDDIKLIAYKTNAQHTVLTKKLFDLCTKYITSIDNITEDDVHFIDHIYTIIEHCHDIKWLVDSIEKGYINDKPQYVVDTLKPIFASFKNIEQ